MDEGSGRARGLLWLGLLLAVAALALEFLWMARSPADAGGMAFAVRRLGLRLELSRGAYEALASAAAAGALGGVAVAVLLSRRAAGASGGAGVWRWALGLVALVVCAVPLNRLVAWAAGGVHVFQALGPEWERRLFFRELGLYSSRQLLWLGALVALGTCLLVGRRRWPSRWLSHGLGRVNRLPHGLLVAAGGALVAVLAAGYSLAMLEGQPHYADAAVYLYQAKTFAAGRLWSPLPGGQEFFDPALCPAPGNPSFAFIGDRWFGVQLPAAPLLYAAGVLVGCPWVVAPLLGGGVAVLTYVLARRLFGRSAALIALLLAALSPWLVMMSGEYLTHVPGALTLLVFLLAALRAMQRSSVLAAAVAGLFLGFSALTRPFTALAFCVPAALAWLVWLVRRPRTAWRPSLAFALALAVPTAALLAYNVATTGKALDFAYWVAGRGARAFHGGSLKTLVRPWTPIRGVSNVLETVYSFGSATFRWPVPAVALLVGAALAAGLKGEPGKRWQIVVVGLTPVALVLGYAHRSDVSYCMSGPRYVFEIVPLVIVLLAGAMVAAWRRLCAAGIDGDRVRATLALAVGFCLVAATVKVVLSELPMHRRVSNVDRRMFDVVEAQAERPALVFLPVPPERRYVWQLYAAIAENDPALEGPILYARDLGPRNHLLAADRPGRHHYRWDVEQRRLVPITLAAAPEPAPHVPAPRE